MNRDPGFRAAVAECTASCRQLSDRDLKAFGCAILAELARRDGATVAATWAEDQSTRLRSLDGVTA